MTASCGGSRCDWLQLLSSWLPSLPFLTPTVPSKSSSSRRQLPSLTDSSSIAFLAATVGGICASTVTSLIICWLHQRQRKRIVQDLDKKRQEERQGRIRAEVKLRNALLEIQQVLGNPSLKNTVTSKHDKKHPSMTLSCIGTIVSPYPKRMGTPRQGGLVPSSRGYIQFTSSLPSEAVEGIEEYSHVWIIFWFHVNTSLATSKKAKVRPPRGGGIKVGQLATRSPHRPNPIGLSLVQIEKFEAKQKRLYIRGLDLVHDTPVYDIKPYVHWDVPEGRSSAIINSLRVPKWVESKEDVLPSVEFSKVAEDELYEMIHKHNKLSPLYDKRDPTALKAAQQTLKEMLAQDPRSSHKGVSENQRGSVTTKTTDPYKLRFGNTQIEFLVFETGAQIVNVTLNSDDDDGFDNYENVVNKGGEENDAIDSN